MTYIIGQLTQAEREREALRLAMRTAKTAKDKAQAKREFRKARNTVLYLKKEMKDK